MTSFPLNLENCLLKLKTKHKVRLLSILHSTYFCKPLKVQSTESPCITCMKGPEKKIALCENHTGVCVCVCVLTNIFGPV